MVRRLVVWALTWMLLLGPVLSDIGHAQQIVPNGLTKTTVTHEGNVTNVTTETTINDAGLNSFSHFGVAADSVVNLHLPQGTERLVNLVYDSRTEIHGVLNSIKNNTVGGKVYIVNPHGIVIGPNGVVNVGSLYLSTPKDMADFFSETSGINPSALEKLYSGQIPISASGNITIQGTINAAKDVEFAAGTVSIDQGGQILTGAVFEASKPDFSDVININGIGRNTLVSFENGEIRIRAKDSVDIKDGVIYADGYGFTDAGDIEVTAGRSIRIEGSQLTARAGGNSSGGEVVLAVSQGDDAQTPVYTDLEAETEIILDGATIEGREITISAKSEADNSWDPLNPRSLAQTAVNFAAGVTLADVSVVRSKAVSQVTIKGGSRLSAKGNISITADSAANTGLMAVSGSSKVPYADFSVAYGELTSHAKVNIDDGSEISAFRLDVAARNVADLDFSLITISRDQGIDSAIAITKADVDAQAAIGAGVKLNVSNTVAVSALNDSSLVTSASSTAMGQSHAGIAVAYMGASTAAQATMGADVIGSRHVYVEAADVIRNNAVVSSTSAAPSSVIEWAVTRVEGTKIAPVVDFVLGKQKQLDPRSGATEQPKGAGTAAVAETSHRAWANVGDGATIDASGLGELGPLSKLVVSAEVQDQRIRNHSTSGVGSSGESDPKNPDASISISAAVSYGDYNHDAQAWIGEGAKVTVGNLALRSRTTVPYQITWHKWEGLSSIIDKLNTNLGLVDGFISGHTMAKGQPTKLGLSGSVSYIDFDNTSWAYVGRGATVNLISGAPRTWDAVLPSDGFYSTNRVLEWDTAVAIDAESDITWVSYVGKSDLVKDDGDPNAVALGASYSQVNVSGDTRAFVSAGATLRTTGTLNAPTVSINASSEERLYLVTAAAGGGPGYGFSGNFTLARIDTVSEASVDHTAKIYVRELLLDAEQDTVSLAVAGAVNHGNEGNVGAGVAIQDVDATVRAFIGDNETAGDPTYQQGEVRVQGLSVSANADGRISTYSVAGSLVASEPSTATGTPRAITRAADEIEQGIEMATFRAENAAKNLDELTDDLDEAGSGEGPSPSPPRFGFGISGSVSYNNVKMATTAALDGAKIVMVSDFTGLPPAAGLTPGSISVTALNTTDIGAFSGAASFYMANAGAQTEVGIAGAAGVNEIANTTEARVQGTSLLGAREMAVRALIGGDQIAVGLGASYNQSGDADYAATVAGSVSVNLAANTARAIVEDVEADGDTDEAGAAVGAIGVVAYNRLRMQAGAGSLAFGGNGGYGTALTYNEANNTTEAVVRDTRLNNFAQTSVNALTQSRIATGGGMAAGTTANQGHTAAGSFVIAKIGSRTAATVVDSNISAGHISVEATDIGGDAELDALLDAALTVDPGLCVGDECAIYDEHFDFAGAGVRDGGTAPTGGSSIVSVAGVLQAGRSNVGVSFSYNDITHQVQATVVDSMLTATEDVVVRARSEADIFNVTAGIGVAAGDRARLSGAGSISVNKTRNTAVAGISSGASSQGTGSVTAKNVTVAAVDKSAIWTLAGQANVNVKQHAVGITIAHQDITNRTEARIEDVAVTADDGVAVVADSRATIEARSVSGAFAGRTAIGGSSVSAVINNETEAAIVSSTGHVLDVGSLRVQATDRSRISTSGGGLGVSGAGAVGATVAVNKVGNTTRATLSGVDVTAKKAPGVLVGAENSSVIETQAIAAGGSTGGALSATVASSRINHVTEAVAGAAQSQLLRVNAAQFGLTATDESRIKSQAGDLVGGAGGSGIGAAISVNRISSTTRALLSGTGSGSIAVGDLLVGALSRQATEAWSLGVAAGARAGVAGSSSTNFIHNVTESIIDNGTRAVAQNNVGVIAESHDIITNVAGAAGVGMKGAGLGASVSVNEIDGRTLAAIRGANTQVSGLAKSGSGISVAQGDLDHEVDLASLVDWGAFDPTSYWRPTLWEWVVTEDVRGVAVNAASTHSIQAFTVNAGISGTVGVGGNTTTNLVKGETRASVDGARINVEQGANLAQSLSVKASDHAYSHGLVGSLGIGGTVGAGVAIHVNAFSRGVHATIRNTEHAGALKQTVVDARSTQGVSSVAIGAGVGPGTSGAGTVNVATFTGGTTATVDNATLVTGDLQVTADQTNRLFYATPAVAVSASGSGAATVSVGVMTGSTRAYVSNSSVQASGGVDVHARSRAEIDNWSISVAGSTGLTVAGNIVVNVIAQTIEGYLDKVALGSSENRARSLNVSATDNTQVRSRAGALGVSVGGLGAGAAAAVTSIRNDTSAKIGRSDVYAREDISVNALATRDVDTWGIAGALALNGSLGGVATVTLIGQHLTGSVADELDRDGNGTLALVDRWVAGDVLTASGGQSGGNVDVGTAITEEEMRAINNEGRQSVRDHLVSSERLGGTSVVVGPDTVLDAGRDIDIRAEERLRSTMTAGSGSGAFVVSFGGSVGINRVTSNVTVELTSGVVVKAGRNISLAAHTQGIDPSRAAVQAESYQGSAGTVTIGAAVADARLTSNSRVSVGPGITLNAAQGNVSLNASDNTSVNARAEGYMGGVAAAGLVSAEAEKAGVTTVAAGAGQLNPTQGVAYTAVQGDINFAAHRSGSVTSFGRAGAGGIAAAGEAVISKAKDTSSTTILIPGNTHVKANGTVRLTAEAKPRVEAVSKGYGGAVIAQIGSSEARAEASPDVTIDLRGSTSIQAKNLFVKALVTPDGDRPIVSSDAEAVGIGAGLAFDASRSTASSDINVGVRIGSSLNIANTADVMASYIAAQRAYVSGIVAGMAAIGGNYADAVNRSRTSVVFDDTVSGTVGSLEANAVGRSDTYSTATSGSGGVSVVAAAKATTDNDSKTWLELGASNLLRADRMSLSAAHTTVFNSQVDSIRASVVGGSGSRAMNTVRSVVDAVIPDGAKLSTDNIDVRAYNESRKPELSVFNAAAGSGGLYDDAAVSSYSVIDHETRTTIGENVDLAVTGKRDSFRRADFSAVNNIVASDKTRLDAGGGIELALATSGINVKRSLANVSIGRNAKLDVAGTLRLAASSQVDLFSSANAKTYGVASAAQGASEARISSLNTIGIGQGVHIRTDGDILLLAGQDLDGRASTLKAVARTDLYNKTAVPIETSPEADAVIGYEHGIDVASGARLLSAGDISFIAHEGSQIADGKGVGTDLYHEIASAVANAFSWLIGAGSVSLKITGGHSQSSGSTHVNIDGFVNAGIYNQQRLIFDANGNVVEQTEGITYEIVREHLATKLHNRLNELRKLRAAYHADPAARAAYDAEINMVLRELTELGYIVYLEDDKGQLVPTDLVIDNLEVEYIVVADVSARSGDITVVAHHLGGTGSLKAPTDTEIIIQNPSQRFLRVNQLIVEDRGGHVYFNGVSVSKAAEINALNRGNRPDSQLAVSAMGSTRERPRIVIANTFVPGPGAGGPIPDIEIQGDVINWASRGTLSIVNSRGSIKIQGEEDTPAPTVSAESIELDAGRSVVQSYNDGFTYIGGDPKLLWKDVKESTNEVRNGTGGWITGDKVFISSRYLVLNGTIQSGYPDWLIDLPASLEAKAKSIFDQWKQDGSPPISSPSDLAPYVLTEVPGRWTAYFNPETEEIVLDDIQVRGGHVELTGAILNTGGGNIRVMSGYGQIKVDNQLRYDLVLNRLDTGNIEGTLRITDTARRDYDTGKPITVTTTYKGDGGGGIRYEQWVNDRPALIGVDGRQTEYRLERGLRYVWQTGLDSVVEYLAIKENTSYLDFIPGGTDRYDRVVEIHRGEERLLPNGEYVEIRFHSGDGWPLPNFHYEEHEFDTTEPKMVDRNPYEICHSWNPLGWCIGKRTKVIEDKYVVGRSEVFTHSLQADHPIAIEFIGYNTSDPRAVIEVVSAGNIILAGDVENLGGEIRLEARNGGSIIQRSDNTGIRSWYLTTLRGESIGDALNPIRVVGDPGALLSAFATHDIYLTIPRGDLLVGQIESAQGDVWLRAHGSIDQLRRQDQSHVSVSGRRITLHAETGGIGTRKGDNFLPLTVNVGQDELAGLRATAPGDINIQQVTGDLRLYRVESTAGDVYLHVRNGNMLDANKEEERDERVIAELLRLWDEMLLIGEGAEQSAQATVDAYVNGKQAEYFRYWSLRGVRPVFDEDGQMTGYTDDPFDPAVADDEYRRLHELYGDTEWDPNWTYDISDEEIKKLTKGAAWTEEELANGLSRAVLFKQTGSTETMIREPNVVGRNVILFASGGGIGVDTDPVIIDATDPDVLKDEAVRLALTSAEADDIGVDNETNTITVMQRRAVNVQASGELEVFAKGHVYIGSRAPLYVNSVRADDSIRIKGTEGIYNVYGPDSTNYINIEGGTILLEGGSGGIGSKESPLRIVHGAHGSVTARAEGDIYLRRLRGDLRIAEMYSRGIIDLASPDSIVDARGARPMAIQGKVINLVGLKVGTHENPLAIVVAPDGRLNIRSEDIYVTSPASLNLGRIETMKQVATTRITSAGDLVLLDTIKDNFAPAPGKGASRVYLTAGGDIDLRGAVEAFHVELVSGGMIRQTGQAGVIKADFVRAESVRGQELGGNNSVNMLIARNRGNGAIRFKTDSRRFDLWEVIQESGGDIYVTTLDDIFLGQIHSSGDIVITSENGRMSQIREIGFVGAFTGGGSLTLSAVGVMQLSNVNSISKFAAINRGYSGDIYLGNDSPLLEVTSITQAGTGNIVIGNAGGGIVLGDITARNGIKIHSRGLVTQVNGNGYVGRVDGARELLVDGILGVVLSGENYVGNLGVKARTGPVVFNNTYTGTLRVIVLSPGPDSHVWIENRGNIMVEGGLPKGLVMHRQGGSTIVTNGMLAAPPPPPRNNGLGGLEDSDGGPNGPGIETELPFVLGELVPGSWWAATGETPSIATGSIDDSIRLGINGTQVADMSGDDVAGDVDEVMGEDEAEGDDEDDHAGGEDQGAEANDDEDNAASEVSESA